MKTIKSLFLNLASFVAAPIIAQTSVSVDEGQRLFIGKNIEYLVDSTQKLSIDEVIGKTFTAGETDILNFGNIPHNVWMRFTLESKTEKDLYLEIMAPLLNQLEVYEMDGNNAKQLFKGGFLEPFHNRPIASEGWLLDLKLKEGGKTTFYMKGQSLYPFQIPVTVSAKNKFLEDNQLHNLFWGIYMGIMIFAFLYNFFIYLSLREKTYLYYLAYILGSVVFYLGLQGYGFQFLWPDVPAMNPYLPIVICVTNIIITLFTMRFLHVTKKQKFMFYFGWTVMTVFGLIALINLTGKYEVAIGLAQLFSLVAALYFIITGISGWPRKVPTAKYFLVGWTFFLVMVIIFILTINNAIPSNFFTTHCIFIGHMTEVLLLSFALADRINWLKKENAEKQQEIIHQLKENEKIEAKAKEQLEAKVEERTREVVNGAFKLKQAQEELVKKEKLAAFGEVATRLAHEIQNPLNFVNNYSKISDELVNEIVTASDEKERKESLETLRSNLKKINEHGGRVSAIVSELQEHGRAGTSHEFFEKDGDK